MKKQNIVCLWLTAIIWGFAFVSQRVGAEHLGIFSFNAFRYPLGFLSLLPLIALAEKKTPRISMKTTVFYAAIAGTVLFAASALQQAGVVLTGSAGKSGFITGLYVVFVPFFSMLLGKHPPKIVWLAAFMAVGGLWLISAGDVSGFGWGDAILLCGAVFWAIHILVFSRAGDKVYPLRFSALQFLVCAIENILCMLLFEEPTLPDVGAAVIPLLYSGILSTGCAYTLQFFGQRNANPAMATLILSCETVFSAVGGALFLHERMSLGAYFGCALIFGAILLCQLPVPKRKQIKNES